jgi:predicted permease
MVATLVTETAEKTKDLPIPPAGFAILALAVFGLLLLVTFAFRSVAHRH